MDYWMEPEQSIYLVEYIVPWISLIGGSVLCFVTHLFRDVAVVRHVNSGGINPGNFLHCGNFG